MVSLNEITFDTKILDMFPQVVHSKIHIDTDLTLENGQLSKNVEYLKKFNFVKLSSKICIYILGFTGCNYCIILKFKNCIYIMNVLQT